MLSIFGDQKTHDPQKTKQMPLKGITAVFQGKKIAWKTAVNPFSGIFLVFWGGGHVFFWSPKSPKMLNIVKSIFFHYIWPQSN